MTTARISDADLIRHCEKTLIQKHTAENPGDGLRFVRQFGIAADELRGLRKDGISELDKRYVPELSAQIRDEVQRRNDPLAAALREIAAGNARGSAPTSTPVPTKTGASYAADFARANGIDLHADRAKFAGLAQQETAFAFRRCACGEDASASARRALHFTLLAGATPEPDLRTLAGNSPPRPGDFG